MKLNLFELAEKQLQKEIKIGKRKKYTLLEIINYAIKIRKWLDKQGGNIEGILKHLLYNDKEIRHNIYLITGK